MMAGLHEKLRFFAAFTRAAWRCGNIAHWITDPGALMCPRAMADGRLVIRALAVGAPTWHPWPAGEIEAELDRMGLEGERRRGCECTDCKACNPPSPCASGSCPR